MIQMARILHPTDFSEPSRHALDYAIGFAEKFGGKIYVLHVIEEVASAMYFDMLKTPPLAQLMQDIERQAEKAMANLIPADIKGKIETEYLIRRGVPFLEIVRCADELNADLIVCGTHGRTGLKHALFGSVAEKIVRKASCPVLSVRHPEHKFEMPT